MKIQTKTKSKGRPFKKFYCDRDEVFLLPPTAFKLWMFYYRLEGAKREGWADRDTICRKCDLSLKTVKITKMWLIEHQWLRQVGTHETRNGGLIPVMQVTRGTIPATPDGRGKSKKSKATQFKRGKTYPSLSGGKLTPPPPGENLPATPAEKLPPREGQVFPQDVDVRAVDKEPDVDGPVKGPGVFGLDQARLPVGLPAGARLRRV